MTYHTHILCFYVSFDAIPWRCYYCNARMLDPAAPENNKRYVYTEASEPTAKDTRSSSYLAAACLLIGHDIS
jgi:hypothetical protein